MAITKGTRTDFAKYNNIIATKKLIKSKGNTTKLIDLANFVRDLDIARVVDLWWLLWLLLLLLEYWLNVGEVGGYDSSLIAAFTRASKDISAAFIFNLAMAAKDSFGLLIDMGFVGSCNSTPSSDSLLIQEVLLKF